jgi:hypothetical protein
METIEAEVPVTAPVDLDVEITRRISAETPVEIPPVDLRV